MFCTPNVTNCSWLKKERQLLAKLEHTSSHAMFVSASCSLIVTHPKTTGFTEFNVYINLQFMHWACNCYYVCCCFCCPPLSRLGLGLGRDADIPSPSFLQLLFINISAVRLSWDYPRCDDPLPVKFVVQVSHDGDPYRNASGLISEVVFVYNGMLFAAYYQFQVLAIFDGVVSEPTNSDYFINGVTGKGWLNSKACVYVISVLS